MKLYMKQKVFSWKDKFSIMDEQENIRYYVEGEFPSWSRKLHVYDANHNEVAFVHEKVMAWMPRFFVEIGGRQVCQIVQKFTLLKPRYELEGLPWHVEGGWLEHEYAMLDGDREIMRLSKHWFTWGDSYELDVDKEEDVLLSLCVVLAIDAAVASAAAVAAT